MLRHFDPPFFRSIPSNGASDWHREYGETIYNISTRMTCKSVQYGATGCPCGVWCGGLITGPTLVYRHLREFTRTHSPHVLCPYCAMNDALWKIMMSSSGNIFCVTGLFGWNSPVTGEFPSQRPVAQNFDVFFELHLNKRSSKQSIRRWLETPPRPLWRQGNGSFVVEINVQIFA